MSLKPLYLLKIYMVKTISGTKLLDILKKSEDYTDFYNSVLDEFEEMERLLKRRKVINNGEFDST